MIDWIVNWVWILMVIWGVCYIVAWISGFLELVKAVKDRAKLDYTGIYPEPLATEDSLLVCGTLETLSESFGNFDCDFIIDF